MTDAELQAVLAAQERRAARWEHLCRVLNVRWQDDQGDGMTEADWAESRRYRMDANQREDDTWRNSRQRDEF